MVTDCFCRASTSPQTEIPLVNVTLSHLRSKEITSIHKPCIPHSTDSRATTKCKLVYIRILPGKVVPLNSLIYSLIYQPKWNYTLYIGASIPYRLWVLVLKFRQVSSRHF